MPAKKGRPPTLALDTTRKPSKTVIEFQTPIDLPDPDSPSSSGSGSDSPLALALALPPDDASADDLSRDLAVLEQLRRSVRKNLRLRPIRSASLPDAAHSPPSDAPDYARSPTPDSAASPESAYYTPLSHFGQTPLSTRQQLGFGPSHSRQGSHVREGSLARDVSQDRPSPPPRPSTSALSQGVGPALLLSRLSSPTRPLLIDTRPIGAFNAAHLQHTVNMAIPSLILRRSRKPANAFHSLDALRQFITTEEGIQTWDNLMSSDDWDGDVIVYDERMELRDRNNSQATAWSLMDVIAPLLQHGIVDYLEGGFAAAQKHPYLSQLITGSADSDSTSSHHSEDMLTVPISSAPNSGGSSGGKRTPSGLRQLDTLTASRSKTLPELELVPSPQPVMPSAIGSWNILDDYSTPSPPPSSTVFSRPQPPRRPSIPALRKLDTRSAERLHSSLPKLQVPGTSNPTAGDALSVPRARSRSKSPGPSRLNLIHSNHSPPPSARLRASNSIELLAPHSPSHSQPMTPRTPSTPMPPSPLTARPDTDQPPTTAEDDPVPVFTVSTILPNFLFLGPEITQEEHVQELLSLGVRRILNIAIECDDDHGLRLRERFEKYVRIPMRDTVEEDNITRGVREACTMLDDARLHSAPTYVHCKAGKSRSVTAVMAYLIHANHWTLSRAYAFVVGRRKGISPNIGFVSELMTFEEQELGGKSVGVVKMPPPQRNGGGGGGSQGMGGHYQVALGNRRPQHLRESLPPAFTTQHSFNLVPMSAGGLSGIDVAQLGDSQQELEIKDAEGRYRHARRAPVDEATLQPMRRVSKAGLESSAYNP
ncbi:hypothetical protein K474DRAFT_1595494 [Panus rudis PR-1116 ss-1]|nr:hypothetical protein K474DRAFT_1595494 [Panus rudis PR-1116 ss-1]